MSATSTRDQQRQRAIRDAGTGKSERMLLIAIVLIGVIGLAISYSARENHVITSRAEATDTAVSDGKLRSDHMILHLNQRGDSPQRKSNSGDRF